MKLPNGDVPNSGLNSNSIVLFSLMAHEHLRVVDEAYCEQLRQQASEYMPYLVGDVLKTYADFGLAPEFQAILGRHLSDLSIQSDTTGDSSYLTVAQTRKNGQAQEAAGEDKVAVQWCRELVVNSWQLKKYNQALTEALSQVAPGELDEQTTRRVAFDWLIFELTADALGNSVDMQEKFDKYVPDYNGQSRYYRSELTVCRRNLESLVDPEKLPLSSDLLEEYHANFRAGVGLALLRDSLLLYGLSREQQAHWVIEHIRTMFDEFGSRRTAPQIVPLGEVELSEWISSLKPRETRKALLAFVLSFSEED